MYKMVKPNVDHQPLLFVGKYLGFNRQAQRLILKQVPHAKYVRLFVDDEKHRLKICFLTDHDQESGLRSLVFTSSRMFVNISSQLQQRLIGLCRQTDHHYLVKMQNNYCEIVL